MEARITNAAKKMGAVTVYGDLDGPTSPTLLREIDGLLERGMINIIIDISGVEWISSSGIGVIAVTKKDLSERNGKLILVCNNKKVISLMDITNLSKEVIMVKTIEEAEEI